MDKVDARSISREAQQTLRRQAIRLRKAGRTFAEIAEIVGVHPSTVRKWWKIYERDGTQGIRLKKRGRKPGQKRTLSRELEQELRRLITDKTPEQLKMPFALWTRRNIQELIRRRWGIEMPVRTIGDYLKRWGFTPQKPLRRSYEQNPQAVQKWLDEDYPAIVARAKRENAETERPPAKAQYCSLSVPSCYSSLVFLTHGKRGEGWLELQQGFPKARGSRITSRWGSSQKRSPCPRCTRCCKPQARRASDSAPYLPMSWSTM
ncbi:IS630 family transposase [Deferrisoma camini]|uniref:IS630 family transposase n=1 Tax=Deferrisoma camini TaxID=1035120 RepID=UPI000A045238